MRVNIQIQKLHAQLHELAQYNSIDTVNWSVAKKTIKDKEYLYLRHKLGKSDRWHYVGRYEPAIAQDLRDAVAKGKHLNQASRAMAKAIVAAGGYRPPSEDMKVLMYLSQQGVFERGGVLVGTLAYGLYQNYLGIELGNSIATEDVDVLARPDGAGTRVELGELQGIPGLSHKNLDTDFRFEQSEKIIQFLAPGGASATMENVDLAQFGVGATKMRFMSILLRSPVEVTVAYRGGINVLVPHPADFALHKFVSGNDQNRRADKKAKDFDQARRLVGYYCEHDPDTLAGVLDTHRDDNAFYTELMRGVHAAKRRHEDWFHEFAGVMADFEIELPVPKRATGRRR